MTHNHKLWGQLLGIAAIAFVIGGGIGVSVQAARSPSPGVMARARLAEGLEVAQASQAGQSFEPGIEPKIEPSIEPGIERRIETRVRRHEPTQLRMALGQRPLRLQLRRPAGCQIDVE